MIAVEMQIELSAVKINVGREPSNPVFSCLPRSSSVFGVGDGTIVIVAKERLVAKARPWVSEAGREGPDGA